MRRKMMGHNPDGSGVTFFPIDQIYNPQDFSEKVFAILKKSSEKFPVKMAMMAVLSRMIGRH